MVDIGQLKQILELVREHELSELELESEGVRLKVRKETLVAGGAAAPRAEPAAPPAGAVATGMAPAPPGAAPRAAEAQAAPEIELAVVKSPIVGTFYRAAEPGARNFVEIGSTVKKGDVLCIIEAMKLMNEIESEYDGEIANAYVENGQPVQYAERLFAIRTR
ncbi:MAG: acetyl-CoA carboxylase biotin carboxyl carrier protein [Acidobacteria bacterium]|nr:acetyl-CoA carboxylase biotin carboxyl carrier protein [Acidobacteriota bacterium]